MKPLLQLRMYDPATDHPIVAKWWEGHGWPVVPQLMLPKLGAVAFFAGDKIEDAAAAWLFMDNSAPVCWLEFMVSNPDLAPKKVYTALKHLDAYLTTEAKINGYAFMLTTCRQDSLVKFHEKHGFTATDHDVTHMVKSLAA
jgi:hypothetical protein